MADRGLTVRLRQDAPVPLELEFSCGPRDVLAIFGPSGSGKTTILRAIAGLHRPIQGHIACAAESWLDTARKIDRPPHMRRVGFVFQDYALFPHLTAAGNVMAALNHRPRATRRAEAERLLGLVHLEAHVDAKPARLSGGERQRVALARALAREPAVLLLDEPFAAVDRVVRRKLHDEVGAIRRLLDIPMVLVTHDFEDVTRLATHLLVLDRGRAVAAGPLAELTSRPDLAWLRDTIGLGSVIDATVVRSHEARGLLELHFTGGTLLAPGSGPPAGTRMRVRIPAREVILATSAPQGLSLHNVLRGTTTAIQPDDGGRAIVQIAVGDARLLAEVTRDAIHQLGLAPGVTVYALVKSVSLDPLASAPEAPGA